MIPPSIPSGQPTAASRSSLARTVEPLPIQALWGQMHHTSQTHGLRQNSTCYPSSLAVDRSQLPHATPHPRGRPAGEISPDVIHGSQEGSPIVVAAGNQKVVPQGIEFIPARHGQAGQRVTSDKRWCFGETRVQNIFVPGSGRYRRMGARTHAVVSP